MKDKEIKDGQIDFRTDSEKRKNTSFGLDKAKDDKEGPIAMRVCISEIAKSVGDVSPPDADQINDL